MPTATTHLPLSFIAVSWTGEITLTSLSGRKTSCLPVVEMERLIQESSAKTWHPVAARTSAYSKPKPNAMKDHAAKVRHE